MQELLISLRSLLELGFPAVALVQLWILWREHRRLIDLLIEVLRERRSRRLHSGDNGAHSESA